MRLFLIFTSTLKVSFLMRKYFFPYNLLQNVFRKVKELSIIGKDQFQILISGAKADNEAVSSPTFEIFPLFSNFLRFELLSLSR